MKLRLILPLVAAAFAVFTPARAAELALVCGPAFQAVYPSPPAGLPSTKCSRALSFGSAASVPAGGGASQLEPVSLLKGLDANSLELLEDLLRSQNAGTIYLHAFVDGGGAGPLEYLRIEIASARVFSLGSGTAALEPVESVTLGGTELRWSVWSPPAPSTTPPDAVFCWNLLTQSVCTP